MKKLLIAAALAAPTVVGAQQTVKIGMPLTLSGQFADAASQMLNGARTYMKMHGDTVAGRKIELITKDVGGPAPDVAKRLSQELVVRDNVDILAGYVLTPNAMAGGDVSAEAKKFMVVMNAATSVVITKSPYMIRTSVTLPQVMETFGTWAATKGGIIALTKSLALDWGAHGIRVTTIIPGSMDTQWFDRFPEQGIALAPEQQRRGFDARQRVAAPGGRQACAPAYECGGPSGNRAGRTRRADRCHRV